MAQKNSAVLCDGPSLPIKKKKKEIVIFFKKKKTVIWNQKCILAHYCQNDNLDSISIGNLLTLHV